MTYAEAVKKAVAQHGETRCATHVNARIIPAGTTCANARHVARGTTQPEIDQNGYYVSDWYSDATVYSAT